jgi:hypothetical protein
MNTDKEYSRHKIKMHIMVGMTRFRQPTLHTSIIKTYLIKSVIHKSTVMLEFKELNSKMILVNKH